AANEARARGGHDAVRFGVGLHVGPVTFGNVGTEDRLDFTVIGPAVNRAARLESLTKELGVPVLASAEFNEVCEVPMKSMGKHVLRGIPQPVEVFTLPDYVSSPTKLRRNCQTSAFQPAPQVSASSSGNGWLDASTSSRSPMRLAPHSSKTLSIFLPPPQKVS